MVTGDLCGRFVGAEVVRLVNIERAKAGCTALICNTALTRAAQAHSEDMASGNYFSHVSLDVRSPAIRASVAGYSWKSVAENIVAGVQDAASSVNAWMKSAGHRNNILNCGYTDIGVGMGNNPNSQYRYYWTQVFGSQ